MRRVLLMSLGLIVLATLAAGGLALRQKRLQELANLAPPTAAP